LNKPVNKIKKRPTNDQQKSHNQSCASCHTNHFSLVEKVQIRNGVRSKQTCRTVVDMHAHIHEESIENGAEPAYDTKATQRTHNDPLYQNLLQRRIAALVATSTRFALYTSPVESPERVRVVDVVVDPKLGGIDSVWTYCAPADAAAGDAFFVPLGPRSVIGFAIKVYEADETQLGFPIKQLKPINAPISGLSLPGQLVDLVGFVAEQYLCPFSMALAAAEPPGVRERIVTAWELAETPEKPHLTPLQKEVVRTLEETGPLVQKATKKLPPATLRALKQLRAKGVVQQSLLLQIDEGRKERNDLLRLTSETEKIEEFLKKEGKKRPAQALTIMRLQTGDPAPLKASEIKALSGITDTTLKAMVDSGLLERVESGNIVGRKPPTPNPAQATAIKAISDAISLNEFHAFLLHGITGSGKTEVYLRAAAEALRKGKQVLYLVPEIALATQAISQLRDRFGEGVAMLHSDLSARERLETWSKIRSGQVSVVLGARSALFAPLTNIGLIVIDEEHETSYKQESAPRYHSKALALRLAKQHGAAVVLGSATPSVESFYLAEQGEITLLELPHRTATATLPSVEVVDLRQGFRNGHPAIIGPALFQRMEQTLERGEQCILFLNRRAYSPFLMCRDCGHQFMCPRCSVPLAYSRTERRLRCHHCGYSQRPPDQCPQCRGNKLNPFGIGTEKVEETVAGMFAASRVARLDRDVAKKKGALEDILARFRSGDLDILVGTQMVAKGLDFPNVTLVGVIAADISLNVPDFRASERTFQLLSQVAGRAGRGAIPGHVVIQTFNPTHFSVTCAETHDYPTFYKGAKNERALAMYPPFIRLVNIILSGENQSEVRQASCEVADYLQVLEDTIIQGPTECVIERLHGRWRMHLLLKLPPESSVEKLGAILRQFASKTVSLVSDVDPYTIF
jgi:primosomal protein N' (replication factor Y)